MADYAQGFVDHCVEQGVDPVCLIKLAQALSNTGKSPTQAPATPPKMDAKTQLFSDMYTPRPNRPTPIPRSVTGMSGMAGAPKLDTSNANSGYGSTVNTAGVSAASPNYSYRTYGTNDLNQLRKTQGIQSFPTSEPRGGVAPNPLRGKGTPFVGVPAQGTRAMLYHEIAHASQPSGDKANYADPVGKVRAEFPAMITENAEDLHTGGQAAMRRKVRSGDPNSQSTMNAIKKYGPQLSDQARQQKLTEQYAYNAGPKTKAEAVSARPGMAGDVDEIRNFMRQYPAGVEGPGMGGWASNMAEKYPEASRYRGLQLITK